MEFRELFRPRRMARHRTGEHVARDIRIGAGATIGPPAPDPEWSRRTSRGTQRRRALDEPVRWNTWTS
ncbi:MAG TPA: hypothetical protein VFJ91_06800 [Gaiellaceae bacterium]|nr:hypothetical protein [Gaiellaceae bacterium]